MFNTEKEERGIMKFAIVGLVCACAVAFESNAQEAVVIQQSGSPLEIVSYSAHYVVGGRYSTEGVMHSVTLKNTGPQNVFAYTISFRSFDVFNEDMGRGLGGISIATLAPNSTTDGSWTQRPYAPFSFDKYGTGVAYVSRVRLEDGTIWSADQAYVLSQMQKIQDDLTADIFENKEE